MKIRLLLILCIFTSGGSYGAAPPVILVLGDSLSSAFGVAVNQGWVSLLQQLLVQNGYPHQVVNASIAGDTTASGLTRLAPALDTHRPRIVIVELGGNDGLRAQPVPMIRENLGLMMENIQATGARIVLAGMRLPPNYGPAYVGQFERIYPELAQHYNTTLVPFLMAGVATAPELMQMDGVHPNAAAQSILLDNVWPHLQPLLDGTD
jgi:acyl-CoA thioesterase-1